MSFFGLIELLQNGPPPVWKPGVLSQLEFAEEVTRIHNERRNMHHAYDLRINDELMSMAQQWADNLSHSKDLAHSGNKYKGVRIGENIAMKWTHNKSQYTPLEVCEQWYSEVRDHDFDFEPSVLTAGHFTQMVWRNSTLIGVGRSQSKDGRSIVVVNYSPPGNVIGEFSMNVLPAVLSTTTSKQKINLNNI